MIGRIYKISDKNKFYIGSTTQTLKCRMKNHRSKSKEESRKNTPLYKYFNTVGWQNSTVELIEEREFETRHALLECEKEHICKYIETQECLNRCKPNITIDEKKLREKTYGKIHRTENKELEHQRVATWRIANPDKYAEQKRRSVEQQRAKRISTQ